MSRTLCFVCSRCEHPICTREDLLMTTVASGTTENAFVYDLEDMLNLETSVPCYSGTEVAEESIVVSDKILELPMPPEARKLALKAVVESHRFQEQLDNADSTHASTEERRGPNDPLNASLHSSAYGISEATEETNERVESTTGQASLNDDTGGSPTQSFPRFGRLQETRVDLICVKEDVLMGGLVRCTKDRVASSASAATSGDHTTSTNNNNNNNNNSNNSVGVDLGSNNPTTTTPTNTTTTTTSTRSNTTTTTTTTTSIMSRSEASLAQMPPAIVDAVRRPPPPTRWSSHPGNFVVEEAFIKVRRRTKTARCPWFEAYECHGRLECPDCHLGLAYLFVRRAPTHNNNNNNTNNNNNNTKSGNPNSNNNNKNNNNSNTNNSAVMGEEVGEGVSLDEKSVEEAQEPHQKRERKEDESRSDDNSQPQQPPQQTELNSTIEFPEIFVGLELKRIRQCEWGLRDFQKRYQQSKDLKTFRELFPESEELESLHGRLRALRTQSELYNNLLCKHKEQIDVQSALLKSQKERILTCEEKLRTMQQIIEAQRVQLEMQDRQIKHQEELVRNHKSQVVTQQHQIQVEQLLLSEQSRTIESQREQIALIQDHLRARLVREQLEARCGRLTTLLHQAEEQRLAQTVNNSSLHRTAGETLPSSNSPVTATYHDSQEEEGDGERERERERERESIQTRRTFQQREESLRLDRQPLRVDYPPVASGSERKSEVEFGDRPLTNKAVSPSFTVSGGNNNNNNEIRARVACSSSTNSNSVSGSNNSNSGDGGSSYVRSTTEHTAGMIRTATEECAQQRVELSTTVQGNNNSSANTIQTTNESERVDGILASAYRRRRLHSLSEKEECDNPPK